MLELLPGVRRLHRHDDAHRGARRRRGARRDRHARRSSGTARRSTSRRRGRAARCSTSIKEHAGVDVHPSHAGRGARARSATTSTSRTSRAGVRASSCSRSTRRRPRPNIVGPTFVCDYPREVSPLARTHRDDPTLDRAVRADRRRPRARATRSASSTTRSTSCAGSRRRPTLAAAGDVEAHGVDADYVRALEYGLPADRRHGHRRRPAGDAARRRHARSAR